MSLLQDTDVFSVCLDSSTVKATIVEEMLQVHLLEVNLLECTFVTVSAVEIGCECSDWWSKLVGLTADGAAVNMCVCSGSAKQL